MSTSTMGRAALAYADRFHWEVFPVRPGTKRPEWMAGILEHGHHSATSDLTLIERMWRLRPGSSIGVNCAASGLVVLDADLYKPDCEFPELESRLGPLPMTPTVLSPAGGVHYYFRDTVGHYRGTPCAGVDVKHNGLTVLPPSTHKNGKPYRWDVGAHVLDTPLADLPDRWLQHLTSRKVKGQSLPSSGIDARDSWLGHAFEAAGWLGDLLPDGKRMAVCPWLEVHSDGRGDGKDSSTVLFPRAEGHSLGGFRCLHGHCDGRDVGQVIAAIPKFAKWKADQIMSGERNRLAYRHLEILRKAVGQ